MKVFLTGVLEDGTPRVAGVPDNPRTNLDVPQGVDLEIVVMVVTPQSVAVNLAAADVLTLTVKRRPEDNQKVQKVATKSGNIGTFALAPNDTKALPLGLYSYDVLLEKDSKKDVVVPLSPFNLQASNAA